MGTTQVHALLISAGDYEELTAVLAKAGRSDLAKKLTEAERSDAEAMTTPEVAALFGVSSANTIKNWINGGWFPGAFKTAGGHWRFPRAEVYASLDRLKQLRAKSEHGDLMPPDSDEEPPLL